MNSFTIICNKCNSDMLLKDNIDTTNKTIEIRGEIEALYDAEVYLWCNMCHNSITIKNDIR